MNSKKIVYSVSASAVLASTIIMAQPADAASYKVRPGDSLWKIASEQDTTVKTLKSLNNLSSDLIHPDMILETDSKDNQNNPSSTSDSGSRQSSAAKSYYTVKSGDTLSAIAHEHNISLQDLMDWNDLDSTLIFPGNEFIVEKGSSGSKDNQGSSGSGNGASQANHGNDAEKESVKSGKVYTVKSGDTLSGIAANHRGVSVANLKKWNNLSSDLIIIGQKLEMHVKGGSSNTNGSSSDKSDVTSNPPASDIDYNVDQLINTANKAIGSPYQWGGQTPGGFDCSGFIHYAYNQSGKTMGRTNTGGYFNRSYYINNPKKGDIVFFKNTYKQGISHMGIYIGGGKFIHAGSKGVTTGNVNHSYWQKHFDSYKRLY